MIENIRDHSNYPKVATESMMITGESAGRKEMYTDLFEILTDETRRRIIRILGERTESISEQELAEQLAATEADQEERVSEVIESLLIELYHIHLPKLVDNGLIEWDRDAQTLNLTDHPMDGIDHLEEKISTNGWDSIASALADGRRRRTLAIVESENGPTRRGDLARELVRTEADERKTRSDVENVAVQLHNHHLPKLEAAGLVEYDIDEATVTYEGPSDLLTVLPESVFEQ